MGTSLNITDKFNDELWHYFAVDFEQMRNIFGIFMIGSV